MYRKKLHYPRLLRRKGAGLVQQKVKYWDAIHNEARTEKRIRPGAAEVPIHAFTHLRLPGKVYRYHRRSNGLLQRPYHAFCISVRHRGIG